MSKIKNRWGDESGLQIYPRTDSRKDPSLSQNLSRRILCREFGLALNRPQDATRRATPQQAALIVGIPYLLIRNFV